jgi:hypothetical protein
VKIQVQLAIDGKSVKQNIIEIEEYRLGELTEEEIQQAIEVKIRTWVDSVMYVEWEELDES